MGFFGRIRKKLLPTVPKTNHEVTYNQILQELVTYFDYSLKKASARNNLLLNTHYLVILHPKTYEPRLSSLPVVVKETVSTFYKRLNALIRTSIHRMHPIYMPGFATTRRHRLSTRLFAAGVCFADCTQAPKKPFITYEQYPDSWPNRHRASTE